MLRTTMQEGGRLHFYVPGVGEIVLRVVDRPRGNSVGIGVEMPPSVAMLRGTLYDEEVAAGRDPAALAAWMRDRPREAR